MQLQSACCSHPLPNPSFSWKSRKILIPFLSSTPKIYGSYIGGRNQRGQSGANINLAIFPFESRSKRRTKLFYLSNSKEGTESGTLDSSQDSRMKSDVLVRSNPQVPADGRVFNYSEPFLGKSGSVSFCGLTHQLIEEGKLVSSPFKDGIGSFVWVVGPVALISSLLLPQFFLCNAVDTIIKDEIFADILISFFSEIIFYIGLATFLFITDRVQQPYLQFSPKRWALITGLRGYLHSAFFTMGFKVFAPVLAVYVVWPVIGLPALVAVAPFLLGCAAQFVFETHLDKLHSSCWPLVPIIFEVYRFYQLSRAAYFIERLLVSVRRSAVPLELAERSGALVSMLVVFQVLGAVCLWSLCTFLLRLFPSRPVAERY